MELTPLQEGIQSVLIQKAKKKKQITYKDLGAMFGFFGDDDYSYNQIARHLGAITEYEVNLGRPMLSVIVVRRIDSRPGRGFFQLARTLKVMRLTDNLEGNRDEFQAEETSRLFAYHGGRS